MTARKPGEKSGKEGKYKMTMTIKRTKPLPRVCRTKQMAAEETKYQIQIQPEPYRKRTKNDCKDERLEG